MSIAKLKTEPIEIKCGDWKGEWITWDQTFWKVFVGQRILTDRARPFGASDSSLILHECTTCGDCGSPNIVVRKVGNTVCWVDGGIDCANDHALGPDELVAFDAAQYGRAIGMGNVRELAPLEQDDLSRFLARLEFPDPDKALYRIPEATDDPLGRRLSEFVAQAITNDVTGVRLAEAPNEIVTIQIGFDLPDYPEAVWEIGKNEDGIAVLFREYPCFPVWLEGERLNQLELSELFSPR